MNDVWGDGDRLTRRQLGFDLALAALFVLVTLVELRAGTTAAAASALLAVAVATRRLLMPLMVALAIAAGLLQMVTTDLAVVADLAYAVCCFTLGAHRDERVRRFGMAAATFATVGAGVWGGLVRPGAGGLERGVFVAGAVGFGATTAVVCLGGWASGFIRHQNRSAVQARVDAQLDAMERRRMADAFDQEQERSRIAADMHDVVAHSWAVVAAQADGARFALGATPGDTESAGHALEVIGQTARSAIADLRTILAQLRYQEATGSTPGYEQQGRLIERMTASGMTIELDEHGQPNDSPLLAITAHRLLSESLTNALKHGDLTRPVAVRQDWTDGYDLTVTNAMGARGDGTGHGIAGMTERAAVAGGTLAAHQVGDTWLVHAHVPAPQTLRQEETQ